MSSALVRQALEFVDQEESGGARGGRRAAAARRRPLGQGASSNDSRPYNRRNKKSAPKERKSGEQVAEENIKKLLALSKTSTDEAIAGKIVERAVRGKPLLEKVEVKVDEGKSILFPDEPPESFNKFEKEYFCS